MLSQVIECTEEVCANKCKSEQGLKVHLKKWHQRK